MAKPGPVDPVEMPDGPAVLAPDPPDRRPDDYAFSSTADSDIVVKTEDLDQGPDIWFALDGVVRGTIRYGLDGEQTTATIEIGLESRHISSPGSVGVNHFVHILRRGHPDSRVRIYDQAAGEGSDWPLFEGYPDLSTLRWSGGGQAVTFECVSLIDDRLGKSWDAQILGAIMRRNRLIDWDHANPDFRVVPAVQAIFNKDGEPNCSFDWLPFAPILTPYGATWTPHCPLFTDPDDHTRVYWTAARAIAYLLARFAPPELDYLDLMHDLFFFRGSEDIVNGDPWVEALTARLPELSATSCSLSEALGLVLNCAGLHVDRRVSNINGAWVHWLNVFPDRPPDFNINRRMRMPLTLEIPRDPPYQPIGQRTAADVAEDNPTDQCSLTWDHRAVNCPFVLGEDTVYEVTVELLPGWRPFPHVSTSYYHYDNDNPDLGPLLSGWLVEVPTIPVLDNIGDLQADIDAARGWWNVLWNKALEVDDPAYQAMGPVQFDRRHPEHKYVGDVGRRWILGESYQHTERNTKADGTVYGEHSLYHRYGYSGFYPATAYPWDDPLDWSLYGIVPDNPWVVRPRPFQPPLGKDAAGGDLPVIVEMRLEAFDGHDDTGWFEVKAEILPDCGGILLIEDNLADIAGHDANGKVYYLEALLRNKVRIRVTTLIEGDDRLYKWWLSPATVQRQNAQVFDERASFAFEERMACSILNDYPTLRDHFPWLDPAARMPGEPLDQSMAIHNRAQILAMELGRSVVSANPELFYPDYETRPGDLVSRVQGLGLDFQDGTAVKAVELEFGSSGRRTRWFVGDDREDGGGLE